MSGNATVAVLLKVGTSCSSLLFEMNSITIKGKKSVNSALFVPRPNDVPAFGFPDESSCLASLGTDKNHGPSSRQNPVQLAGNTEASHIGS